LQPPLTSPLLGIETGQEGFRVRHGAIFSAGADSAPDCR
jgi:hypothetical protein